MKLEETKVLGQPEILKVHTGGEYTKPITLDTSAFTSGVCKAGTPISAAGKKVNGADADADAAGILLNTVTSDNPNGTILVAFGVIDEAAANASAGITINAKVKTALANLVFA